MKLTCCPRCNGEWVNSSLSSILVDPFKDERANYYACLVCNMRSSPFREELTLRNPLKEEYHLVWFLEEEHCGYSSLEEAYNDNILILPWLPFSITKERLSLVLLFS